MQGVFLRRAYPSSYTITFDAAGGVASATTVTTDANGRLTAIPTAYYDGYNFLGWFLSDGTQVTADTVFTADTTVTAQWQSQNSTIVVTGTGSYSNCYLTINGARVYRAGTYTVENGATIVCYLKSSTTNFSSAIKLNGTTVKLGSSALTYNYAVTMNAAIALSYGSASGTITITEG